MFRINRLGHGGMLLVALLASGGLILGGRMVGERHWGLPTSEAKRRHERQRIDEDIRGTIARMEGKRRIIPQLLDGRMTFLEAAAHFRALDRLPPPFFWDRFRIIYPGASDEERHCREVIAWLETHEDNCLILAAVDRFESELKQHLDRGTLHLPEVGPEPRAVTD